MTPEEKDIFNALNNLDHKKMCNLNERIIKPIMEKQRIKEEIIAFDKHRKNGVIKDIECTSISGGNKVEGVYVKYDVTIYIPDEKL